MKQLYFTSIFLVSTLVNAQVGIGTTSPQETLHIEGDLIVEGYNQFENSTMLVGADSQGNLTTLTLNNELTLENNRIQLANSIYYGIGRRDLTLLAIGSANRVHNLDLKLGLGEANHGKTVIKVSNLPGNIKLTGIQDGVDGQHLFFYHAGKGNIVFLDEQDSASNFSLPRNRIKVLAGSETISGQGSIELFYDGALQRWVILSIHD
ncbi:hypothetical protein AAU57_06690 [Nonlabens sp. YIK11]|uniref:hypothetical protein n=1 Tax=Nonlabens sp. YIK11 TaxID=1453349 RepID=UPI0006DBE123|nr:hypothetical protein [Nonlabens sp. YIK11]KQC33041.1 hypothetical protein AAU57_06690 [Nonlabens sp. YIK11]